MWAPKLLELEYRVAVKVTAPVVTVWAPKLSPSSNIAADNSVAPGITV